MYKALFAVALATAACAPVQQQSIVSTPISQSLIAGVGDTVLRAEGRENLPNAFGRADIFGRTRPTGFTVIQYGGLQGDKVVLLRSGVVTQSEATTMNSTGIIVPTQQQTNISGMVGMQTISGTATTTGTTYIPPRGASSISSQQPTIPIVIDWRKNPRVSMLGQTIVIEAATATSMSYRIE
jgi:hypothetical protein